MSLTRKRILDEMGLSPQWILRVHPKPMGDSPCAETDQTLAMHDVQAEASQYPVLPGPALTAASAEEMARTDNKHDVLAKVMDMDWPQLRQTIMDCHLCGLCAKRKQAVPGVGDEQADWLFIGEGPGAEEDARGEPFVGQAGRLLDAMLAAIDLERGKNVYIANAVKCRPPGNRTPELSEMAACRPYLQRQIELLQPKLIVLLGKAAVAAVLGEERSLASMRGRSLIYRQGELEIPTLVTYHPAYLLRNLPDKAKAWEDLCRARALMQRIVNTP